MLSVERLEVRYGGVRALKGVSLEVPEGSVVTLIGANGAGKTTTLRAISGMVPWAAGDVRLGGRSLRGHSPEAIARLGVVQVPEGRRIFRELSVEENLRVGAYLLRDQRRVQANLDAMFEMFPRMRERRRQPGGTLSGGEQQMLAFARALMSEPRLLLLDEPSLGLAPQLVREVAERIRGFRDRGLTVLLVEQNANVALEIADRGYVLEVGQIALSGDADELRSSRRVREAYLGVAASGPVGRS
jgi:branched-chain amino acid transport system ATP-binding protein